MCRGDVANHTCFMQECVEHAVTPNAKAPAVRCRTAERGTGRCPPVRRNEAGQPRGGGFSVGRMMDRSTATAVRTEGAVDMVRGMQMPKGR